MNLSFVVNDICGHCRRRCRIVACVSDSSMVTASHLIVGRKFVFGTNIARLCASMNPMTLMGGLRLVRDALLLLIESIEEVKWPIGDFAVPLTSTKWLINFALIFNRLSMRNAHRSNDFSAWNESILRMNLSFGIQNLSKSHLWCQQTAFANEKFQSWSSRLFGREMFGADQIPYTIWEL